ncbi:MAG TPA: hypothetical protein DEO38_01805 [Bacteroidales bacterium]|nr:hypothetical protein [Bacteroidales bacterium]
MIAFVSVLETGLLVFCVCELLASTAYPKMQRQIFYLAFAFSFVWSTLKFAYGPDIITYIPLYRTIESPLGILSQWGQTTFESGFSLFTSLCKFSGLSFWAYTAVISTLYFVAIFLLLRKVSFYPTIALTILLSLDSNLYLKEFRQCLAVTFFIFAILLFSNRKYFWSLLCFVACSTMHHSAIYIIFVTALLYGLSNIRTDGRSYAVLALMLIILAAIPWGILTSSIKVNLMTISDRTIQSLFEHLTVTSNGFQKIVIIYLALICALAYYLQPERGSRTLHWMMWTVVFVIVLLSDYWFLLNRIRSYFLPFLVVYTSNVLDYKRVQHPTISMSPIPRQVFGLLLLVFVAFDALYSVPQSLKRQKYPTDDISLIVGVNKHNEELLTEKKMRRAIKYWENDFKAAN